MSHLKKTAVVRLNKAYWYVLQARDVTGDGLNPPELFVSLFPSSTWNFCQNTWMQSTTEPSTFLACLSFSSPVCETSMLYWNDCLAAFSPWLMNGWLEAEPGDSVRLVLAHAPATNEGAKYLLASWMTAVVSEWEEAFVRGIEDKRSWDWQLTACSSGQIKSPPQKPTDRGLPERSNFLYSHVLGLCFMPGCYNQTG